MNIEFKNSPFGPVVEARALEIRPRYPINGTKSDREQALERALGQFKRMVQKDGILMEIRERQYFKSPGQKAYEKRKKAIYRNQLKKSKVPAYRSAKAFNNNDR